MKYTLFVPLLHINQHDLASTKRFDYHSWFCLYYSSSMLKREGSQEVKVSLMEEWVETCLDDSKDEDKKYIDHT